MVSLHLLKKAKQVIFGFKDVPENTEARRITLATIRNESIQQRLDELEKQFWEDPDNLGKLSEAFAIHHDLVKVNAQQCAPADGLRPPLS